MKSAVLCLFNEIKLKSWVKIKGLFNSICQIYLKKKVLIKNKNPGKYVPGFSEFIEI
jgi:hypothetical protein